MDEREVKDEQEIDEETQEAEMDLGSDNKDEADSTEEPESADVYKDRWVRLAAEFDNYKKRTLRERDALIQSANERLIRELLPVVDSADRAAAHTGGDDDSEAFKTGVRMILEELPKILANRGLKEMEAKGLPFDPNLHEALMQVASDEDAGNVVDVVERGYLLGESVLRHAKVVVSQGPAVEDASDS
jgi:molecular chaperone GrpE